MTREERILEILKNADGIKSQELAFLMGVSKEQKDEFEQLIFEMIGSGDIFLTKAKKLVLPSTLNLYKGAFHANTRGFGFVKADMGNGELLEIYIPKASAENVMNKDIVLVDLFPKGKGKRREGQIIKIISRPTQTIVGTFVVEKVSPQRSVYYVKPDDPKINYNFSISKKDTNGAVHGHKVVIKLDGSKALKTQPKGEIVEILGHINDPGVDILSIIKQFGFELDFPLEAIEQAKNVRPTVSESDIVGRKDFRDILTVTIDGEDAKDLDDGISLEKLDNGYRLYVHIADVAHYVTEGSPLDVEAKRRGTSVYLVDRVIPMLPHKLSNGICSLNANEDRLALSCVMDIDGTGRVVSHSIVESVINVDKRMSYKLVTMALDGETDEYKEYMPMINGMAELCKILRHKRVERGALDFGFPEGKILLDPDGTPVDVVLDNRTFASNIIEEFMLVANETVSEEYYWLEIPFLYRNHAQPDRDKLEQLGIFLGHFGYSLKGGKNHPKSFQNLLTKLENTPEEVIISRIVLRSMKQARYSDVSEGHFGLSAKYYSHFTSPIRRYPDLQIHRIIKENLNGKMTGERIAHYEKILHDVGVNCSSTERKAEEAERETDNYKKVQFMSDKIGQAFEGVITSVVSWGIYVELSNTIEGMVHVTDLGKEYFEHDKDRHRFIGEISNKIYTLGDKIEVRLTNANLETRKLDFEIVEGDNETKRRNKNNIKE